MQRGFKNRKTGKQEGKSVSTLPFFKAVEKELREAEEFTRKLLDSDVLSVLSAGQYILKSGGKRVRPAITLLSGKMLGAEEEKLIPVSAAMEFIHTATLLHDDIVDGAKLRRGKPSANAVFGSDVAVLVGDYMFAKAVWTFAEFGGKDVLKVALRAIQEMSEGELIQLERSGKFDPSEEAYFDIIYRKTATLISACTESGAIIASSDSNVRERLRLYGKFIGFSFQIIDDILDFVSDDKSIGKPAGNDLKEGKITYPLISIIGKLTEQELNFARSVIENAPAPERDINRLRELVIERGGVKEAYKKALEFSQLAKRQIEPFAADNLYAKALLEIADFIVSRSF